jgi:hypothetical protein
METLNVKQFKDVIRQPSWREGSERFLVNLEDKIVPDFDNAQDSGEILTRLINEEISYVALGTTTNQAQANSFITRNNNNGTFINNSNYNTALDQLANYISSQISSQVNGDSQYVLVGEPLNIEVIPSSLRTNTQTPEYPQGRWRIDHDYNFFENSLGQASWAGQWQKDLQMVFDKPGRYELWFGDKHPNPRYVYAHRRPVADFSLNVSAGQSNFTVSTIDRSYDPDAQSQPDKGIAQKEWKWKETTATSWNNGQIPSSLPLGKDYIVQLRVQDKQGVWSQPEARYVTTSNVVAKPVANFELPNTATRYDNLNVSNTSYDPAGRPITQQVWTVKKNGTQVYSGSTPITNFNSYGEGTYEVSLKVQNNAGLWSEEFKRTITITGDTTKPEATFNPARQDWTKNNVTVTVTFKDDGGSGFAGQRYAVTNSITPPTSGWSAWSTATTQNITLTNEGKWYIHVEAKDNAGNIMQRTMGEYQIDKTAPNAPTFVLSNSAPTNQNITLTINFPADAVQKQYQIGDAGIWTDYTAPLTITDNVKVNARAIDIAGNVSTASSVNITNIDKVAPVAATLTADKTAPTNTNVTVTATFPADAVVKEYKIGVSGTWTPYTAPVVMTDNGTVFVRSKDAAGNVSPEASYTVSNIDKVAPVAATLTPDKTAPTNTDVLVTINYPADAAVKEYKIDNGAWTPYTSPVVVTQNATVYARSKDAVGNVSPESSYVVNNIDKEAPAVATLTADKTAPTNTDVRVTISYPADAVVKEYKVGNGAWTAYTSPVFITQNATVYARSKDVAGNISAESSYNVTNIDKVAPETPTLAADVTTPTNKDVVVTVTFPADATVKQYKVGNGAWANYTDPIVISQNTTVYARAYDVAGNVSAEGSYVVDIIDKVAPSAPKITQNIDVITLTPGEDDRNGIKDTQIRINGGEWTSYTAPIKLADGEYTIDAKSIDGVGNESVATLHTFVYDDTLKQAEFLVTTAEKFPAQSKIDEAKAVVDKLPDVAPEKQPLLDRLKQAEAKINNTKVTNDLNDIERLLDRVNTTNDQLAELKDRLEDLKAIVEAMPDGTEKDALLAKIKELEDKIAALEKANELKQKLDTLKDKGSLVDLIDLINTLPDGELKDKLEKQVEDAQNLIDAKDQIADLVQNPTWDDLQKAKDAVNKLPNGSEKDKLLEQLKEIEEQLKARDAVAKAEETLSKADFDKAMAEIAKVDDLQVKQELLDRLDDINDTVTVVGAVEKAEKTRNQTDINNARTAVNALPDGELKDNLLFRLDKIDGDLANATLKVKTAETARTDISVAKAEEAIEKLIDSPQKQALVDRLNSVKDAIAEKKSSDAIANATKKVEIAEQYKRDPYLADAFEVVNALPNSAEKQALLDRLNTIVANNEGEKQSNEEEAAKAKQLKEATDKVERAESLKREPYITDALNAVNALPNSPEKQALLDRLQAIKDALDADALAKVVAEVTKKVEIAERYKRDPYITDAYDALNSLPNGDVKTALKNRLDAIVVKNPGEGESTEDGEFNPGDNVVDVAETIKDPVAKEAYLGWAKAVERAEKYFAKANIKLALEKLEEVPVEVRNNPKYKALYDELKGRTDALRDIYNQMVADKNLEREIQKATNAVEFYERYRTALFKNKAQTAVDNLADGTVKTMLQARIDAVVEKK